MPVYFYNYANMFEPNAEHVPLMTWIGGDVQAPRKGDYVMVGSETWEVQQPIWDAGGKSMRVYCSKSQFNL